MSSANEEENGSSPISVSSSLYGRSDIIDRGVQNADDKISDGTEDDSLDQSPDSGSCDDPSYIPEYDDKLVFKRFFLAEAVSSVNGQTRTCGTK